MSNSLPATLKEINAVLAESRNEQEDRGETGHDESTGIVEESVVQENAPEYIIPEKSPRNKTPMDTKSEVGTFIAESMVETSAFQTSINGTIEDIGNLNFDSDDSDNDQQLQEDPIFKEIKNKIANNRRRESNTSESTLASFQGDEPSVKTASNFRTIPYGFQPVSSYEHAKKNTDISGVIFNGRMKQFVIIDAKGIMTWSKEAVDNAVSGGLQHRVTRAMNYPKYEYRLVNYLVYAKKHNVYFALWKDFSLKVLNKDFEETCSVSANLRSVLFMLFNPVRDELITGGVGGTKVWRFHQTADKSFSEIKAMANYGLSLKYEMHNVGGSWVKKVELDQILQHLYFCSDTDLYAYDLQGNLLFKFMEAHSMSITGCVFSVNARLLVTCSADTEVKVWSIHGGHIHTFRGHSRAVTNLCLHPETSSLVLTSSLDGTVRMWSLDIMEMLYSTVMSADGILWMGITEDRYLWVSTVRNLTVWSVNYITQFWALTRNKVNSLSLAHGKGKSTRVVALGEDSSVRLFGRRSRKNLSTVLPPPNLSPMDSLKDVAYCRQFNAIFLLFNPKEMWVYTTRTDPACRVATWDLHEIQEHFLVGRSESPEGTEMGDNEATSRPRSKKKKVPTATLR